MQRPTVAACAGGRTPQWVQNPGPSVSLELTEAAMSSSGILVFSCLFRSRKRTLWSTCLNTQWCNIWFPITLLSTGQSLPQFLYGSLSSELSYRLIIDVLCDICTPPMDLDPVNKIWKCARLYTCLVRRCILLSFVVDQIVLSWRTSKDDFSALSGLEMTGLKMSFLYFFTEEISSGQLHGFF